MFGGTLTAAVDVCDGEHFIIRLYPLRNDLPTELPHILCIRLRCDRPPVPASSHTRAVRRRYIEIKLIRAVFAQSSNTCAPSLCVRHHLSAVFRCRIP